MMCLLEEKAVEPFIVRHISGILEITNEFLYPRWKLTTAVIIIALHFLRAYLGETLDDNDLISLKCRNI